MTTGAVTMILTQIVMVAVMTMTPIHMQAHGHDLSATGLVIAVHIGAMYLPSPLTGLLVDRLGRVPVAVAAGLTLLAVGIVAATAPTGSVAALAVALALLGLGWNLGLVSGTAMITDALPLNTRARTQGTRRPLRRTRRRRRRHRQRHDPLGHQLRHPRPGRRDPRAGHHPADHAAPPGPRDRIAGSADCHNGQATSAPRAAQES